MSLFQRPLRPPAILSDEAVERYLLALRAEVSLDPVFRRRLRGAVLNRFVADREGRDVRSSGARRMGALGRAVLYASFALSVGVSTTMAASQGAVPGDALYPLKLQIERVRLQALPERWHDDLAAHALGERIHELGELAERGEYSRMAAHAAAVERDYREFLAATNADGSADRHLVVLTGLLDRLPASAQLAIGEVIEAVHASEAGSGNGVSSKPTSVGGRPTGGNVGDGGIGPGRPGTGSDASAATASPRPTPAANSKPEATPKPKGPQAPAATPKPSRSPRPSDGESADASAAEDPGD